ncbi:MAG TPA: hypothetical protein VM733_12890 [Thermoanaerobaculia bacterium]|nr:hypothetical protein [Thermoanaerobaculia bacterium]
MRILTLIAILASLPLFAAVPMVVTDGQTIWLEEGAHKRVVITDPLGASLPSWFGDRIAYSRVRTDDRGMPHTEIVVLKESGDAVRVIAVPEDTGINGLVQLGWRDAKRVFIEGHVNPSVSLYLEWNTDSGELTFERPGTQFAVSPDGRSLAQRSHVPMGAPDDAGLEVDGHLVYGRDEQLHNFLGAPVWSADSRRLAVLDDVGGATYVVSFDAKNAKAERQRVVLDDSRATIEWNGDAIVVRTPARVVKIRQ